jgi:hypothetical protein
MSETIDPRLERHRPALRYDSQETYRAMSAASITDNPGNALLDGRGGTIAAAGGGLSLAFLTAYPDPKGDDKLDEAPKPADAARRFQADPAYADRCYGRVAQDGGRTWLQYWFWSYDNPKNLLGFGRHEGDWEVIQVGLGADDEPEVATFSQHTAGEARAWAQVEKVGAHPVVYVAPLSHANYYEAGAHPYLIGVDNPDGRVEAVFPKVEAFGDWGRWIGRWGSSTGVAASVSGGKFGGRSPASPGRQGMKWDHPALWHRAALVRTPFQAFGRVVRSVGRLSYPRLTELSAQRAASSVAVGWRLDGKPLHAASRLLVTLHPAGQEEIVLAGHPVEIKGSHGTADVPLPDGAPAQLVVRASAFNRLRQRSDPLESRVG